MSNAKYRPGEAIAKYRKAQGVTRIELAKRTGIHVNIVARIEKTNRGCWINLVTLFDALDVDLQLIA